MSTPRTVASSESGDDVLNPTNSVVASSTTSLMSNPKYLVWIRHLSSLTAPILARVINCTTFAQVWQTLANMHMAQTQASLLKMQLQTTKKGKLSMADYIQKMRTISDNLSVSLTPASDTELVSHILSGLNPDYDSLIDSVYVGGSSISLEELTNLLLNHEARMIQRLEIDISINIAARSGFNHSHK
ncbi:hypothetical protein LIER_09891 [Lithospermum erythrorhizon]|uniref:Retrovirus-related Pol polyprotein from transposon RE1 n=1 Tax=Lithospermum erythrorhizon TaxID=34254 RepID=A0AAV3PH97_LITER